MGEREGEGEEKKKNRKKNHPPKTGCISWEISLPLEHEI